MGFCSTGEGYAVRQKPDQGRTVVAWARTSQGRCIGCAHLIACDRVGPNGREPGVILTRAKAWARNVKRDAMALRLASHDPRVPWYAKVIAVAVVAYALSPIDLIPDFIPVLGYLDDAVIVPAGILLAIRCIPPELMAEFRERAASGSRRN